MASAILIKFLNRRVIPSSVAHVFAGLPAVSVLSRGDAVTFYATERPVHVATGQQ
jgi:hypothetical protein